VLSEDLVPVEIAGLQLRNRRMSAVIGPGGRANSKAAFRKIQPIARPASNAIVGHPANVSLIYSTLIQHVLQQPPHRVVRERRNDCRVHAEASLQPARDVIFPTAFTHLETARGRNPPIPRIESNHHLAQTNQVPSAMLFRLNSQRHCRFFSLIGTLQAPALSALSLRPLRLSGKFLLRFSLRSQRNPTLPRNKIILLQNLRLSLILAASHPNDPFQNRLTHLLDGRLTRNDRPG